MSAQIEGLVASITAMERAQVDLDRAVIITGIGALLADDIRERLVRMRIEAQRVKAGTANSQKSAKETKAEPRRESVYVTVRHSCGTYLARTSPPAVSAQASCTSSAKDAAIRAARKAVPYPTVTGAFEDGDGIWRVEFLVAPLPGPLPKAEREN